MGRMIGMDQAVDKAPPGWADIVAIGEAEFARGESVPASVVHDMIRTALAELERELAETRATPEA